MSPGQEIISDVFICYGSRRQALKSMTAAVTLGNLALCGSNSTARDEISLNGKRGKRLDWVVRESSPR